MRSEKTNALWLLQSKKGETMKKEERMIYYDTDLQVEVYEFKGIAQKFGNHFHDGYVIGLG